MNTQSAARKLAALCPGISVGVGGDTLFAYCRTRQQARQLPDTMDGFTVVKRVVGAVRPARF